MIETNNRPHRCGKVMVKIRPPPTARTRCTRRVFSMDRRPPMRGSTIVRRSGSSRITPGSEAHPAGVTTRGLEPGETHPAAFARPGLAGVPVVQRPRQIGQARREGLFQVVGPPRRHPTLGPVPRHAQRPQIPSHRPMGRIGPPRIKIGFHLRQAPVECFTSGTEMRTD